LLLEQQPSPFQFFATNRGIAATTTAQQAPLDRSSKETRSVGRGSATIYIDRWGRNAQEQQAAKARFQ